MKSAFKAHVEPGPRRRFGQELSAWRSILCLKNSYSGLEMDWTIFSLESPFFALYPEVDLEECETREPPCGITVFLPTNDAFADLDLNTLLADEDIGYRIDHHVIPGLWESQDLNQMSGLTLDSIMNRPVDFSWDIAGFLIEGELPTATDISATNGIVHEVSTFLELPELPDRVTHPPKLLLTVLQFQAQPPDFSPHRRVFVVGQGEKLHTKSRVRHINEYVCRFKQQDQHLIHYFT